MENVPSGLDSSPGRGGRGCLRAARVAQSGSSRCFARRKSTPGVAQEQPERSHGLFGHPRVCPMLRQLQGLALAGRASPEHHFPRCLEPLCIQRTLGRISRSSPPSLTQSYRSLSCAQSLQNQDPAQEKRDFGELTRQLLLPLPNVQEMPLESPVGLVLWGDNEPGTVPCTPSPSAGTWHSWECIQGNRVPSNRHQAGFAWNQRIMDWVGLEGTLKLIPFHPIHG